MGVLCRIQGLDRLGTGPRVKCMFPVENLRLPLVALVFVAAAAQFLLFISLLFGMLVLVTHLPLGYNNWLLEVC